MKTKYIWRIFPFVISLIERTRKYEILSWLRYWSILRGGIKFFPMGFVFLEWLVSHEPYFALFYKGFSPCESVGKNGFKPGFSLWTFLSYFYIFIDNAHKNRWNDEIRIINCPFFKRESYNVSNRIYFFTKYIRFSLSFHKYVQAVSFLMV